ncbi:MAG TPA: hypothetical protein VE135_28655 [Pyrinomonadaceae bacterium]|nr:hypothetical protein [Pyrinomonadaceae bacterium]
MADDRMKNPDQEKNLGGKTGSEGGQYGGGQQAPGRNPQDDKSTGQRGRNEEENLSSEHGRQGGQNIGGDQSKGQGGSNR